MTQAVENFWFRHKCEVPMPLRNPSLGRTGPISDMTKTGKHPVKAAVERHDMIVARFEAFLETNPSKPLYLTEICAGIGVAERTLRAACERHLGMGPVRYLTLRRMHLVRRALRRADASTATVTRIATDDHGFWELGRFAGAYRSIFGESPSVTLHRPPEDLRIFQKRCLQMATWAR